MNFESVNIRLLEKGSFTSNKMDNICHIKTLPYLSVVQATCGSYDIKLGNSETFSTGEGGFFIAPSDVSQTITHHENKEKKLMTCRWVFLKIKVDDIYNFDSLCDFPIIIPEEYKNEMNKIFDALYKSDNVFDENVNCCKIARILSLIAIKKEIQKPIFLENALSYIKKHYKEKISVKELAENSSLSPSYFFALFKKAMGISPITYLNNYRLSLASEELINTKKNISEISFEVGIDDSVYFNKLFRKNFNISPSKYREIHKGKRISDN